MLKKNIQIFTDGASRGNPGPSGAGIYIFDKTSGKKILEKKFYLGKKTNNQAEYLALAIAAFYLKKNFKESSKYSFHFFADSELLVRQMTKKYKIKNETIGKIKLLIDSLLKNMECNFKHVLREKNKIADKLANEGLDSKTILPKTFVNLLKKFF